MFYLFQCFIYSNVLFIRMFYLFECFIYLNVLFIRIFHLFECFIYSNVLFIRMFHLFECFIYSNVLFIRMFYLFECFIYSNVSFIRMFYLFECCFCLSEIYSFEVVFKNVEKKFRKFFSENKIQFFQIFQLFQEVNVSLFYHFSSHKLRTYRLGFQVLAVSIIFHLLSASNCVHTHDTL